jgi:hypothetical protein
MITVLLRTILLLNILVILIGCENKSEDQLVSIPISKFSVPEDGKLIVKQVEEYIAIRHRVIRELNERNRREMITLIEGEVEEQSRDRYRYFDEIEKEEANKSGMSYKEYLWIKDTVISTQTTLWLQQYYEANNKIVSLLDKTLTRYKQTSDDKLNKEEQKIMDTHVNEMKQELNNLRKKIQVHDVESEAYAHNSAIVSTFKDALESLEKQHK